MSPRTLVVTPNWVGDLVMALPVLEALARDHREVWALAKPNLVPLLESNPHVHGVLQRASSDGDTLRRVREIEAAESVILPNSFRSATIPFRAGIPVRLGYRGDWRAPLLNPAIKRPTSKGRSQIEDYKELLQAHNIAPPLTWVPSIHLTAEMRASGEALLQRAKVRVSGRQTIGLFPGAEFGKSKRWPRERFAETIRQIRRAAPNVNQVIVVGPKEVWLGVRLYEATGKIHPVIGPDLDLAGLATVLSQLDLLVTNDSGPMHLAAAVGTPTVAIFGPTDPVRTAPAGLGHQVVYADRWCSPCFRKRCPLLHHHCMKKIEVDEVVQAALKILRSP
ncbi:MAG: lipopolysaccharide heptosyltransferase II [Thermoanaerobaculia bacterium]